eukprot:2010675-Pyramimonas_sp.AAC.1
MCSALVRRAVGQGPTVQAFLEAYHGMLLEPTNVLRARTVFSEEKPDVLANNPVSARSVLGTFRADHK